MNNQEYDLLVVGSGPGGHSAAITAAELGKRVALVERKPYLGGVSLQTGTIPSKALREAAFITSRSASLGMRRAIQQQVASDSAFLVDAIRQKQQVVDHKAAKLLQELMTAGVNLIPGEASFLDAHRMEVRGPHDDLRVVSAEVIVLAAGSRPRRPDSVPFDKQRILDSTSILKIRKMPESLIIAGGGVIACEYASIFAAFGSRVTLIDSHAQLLAYLDADIVSRLADHFDQLSIDLRMSRRIEAIVPHDQGVRVNTDKDEEIEGEVLLYALGRVPNYDALALANAELNPNDKGWLTLNENNQTAQEHIYVVGDLAGHPALASTAMEQGRMAVRHAFADEPFVRVELLPMAIYTIPELSYLGETERELKARGADYVTGQARYADNSRGLIIGNEHGLLKLLVDRQSHQLLGVHIIGESACELIHVGQMAMRCKATVETLASNVFNYPTLGQCYKTAALECQAALNEG
jgi:NAD(P) transhydrogenase